MVVVVDRKQQGGTKLMVTRHANGQRKFGRERGREKFKGEQEVAAIGD